MKLNPLIISMCEGQRSWLYIYIFIYYASVMSDLIGFYLKHLLESHENPSLEINLDMDVQLCVLEQ